MYLMTCTRPDLAYPLSLLARYVAPSRHRMVHWDAAKRVLHYLFSTSGMGLVLGGRARVVVTGHADASWSDDLTTQRSCEAEIYAGAMAAQELCWLTYLLTDLGEPPCSPPVLYVNNKAMIALCLEHRLEHRTKHIALRYFLARELQQRGQLRLAYVATRANTADVFTKALPPGDHQRFAIVLGLLALLVLTGLQSGKRHHRQLQQQHQQQRRQHPTAAATLMAPIAGSSAAPILIDDTPLTRAQQLAPTPREIHRSANFTTGFYSNSDLYKRSPGHRASESLWHERLGHPSNTTLNNTIKAAVLDKDSLLLPDGGELQRV
ncbi:unnamed protein product [Closterium sp. NIES-53]